MGLADSRNNFCIISSPVYSERKVENFTILSFLQDQKIRKGKKIYNFSITLNQTEIRRADILLFRHYFRSSGFKEEEEKKSKTFTISVLFGINIHRRKTEKILQFKVYFNVLRSRKEGGKSCNFWQYVRLHRLKKFEEMK